MKNLIMKKRIAAMAAAAIMSISCIGGNYFNGAYMATGNTSITAFAANSSVVFTESKGCAESAYAEWAPVENATGYNVYCDGTQIDSMLIRQYSGYFRADAVGLKAGSHTLKVVPVISGSADSSKSAETTVTVTSYDREGFCFSSSSVTGGTGLGAYNDDGTLKSNAVVLYLTEDTKNTMTMSVQTAASKFTDCTGIGEILSAMQKGYEQRPIAIRIVGTVTASGVTTSGDSNNLLLKASSTTSPIQNITVEGIGEDATCYGFGIRCNRARSIEIRNLAVMLFGDDGIALETDNYNIWVHNNDVFYGTAGSDADQAKGDGSMDLKNDSKYITISYNHFWDSGKMSLCGMKSETGENFITYHHNWFDHSDSRHPRIRTMSVHVYNNYYDGNSKYGVGVTTGACAFVESNYFRNCPNPMLSSLQGTDALGEGTFSGENGGVIKSYGNYMEGQTGYITYAENNTSFDAYEVSSPTQTVPSSVKALVGGTSYTNFDTASTMYKYTADAAKDVPAIVTSEAGRINGGDFEFEFNDSVDDSSYALNTELMTAIKSYKTSVIAIGSGFKDDSSEPIVTTTTTTATTANIVTTTTKTTTTVQTPVTGDVIYCSPNGTGNGSSISTPTDVKTAIGSVKAGGTIYLLDGTYSFSETIIIAESNSGTASAYKTISAYPGAEVVWDFSALSVSGTNRGVVLDGSYWHWYGFEITKAGDNGMLLSGDNNKIEMMVFNDNQDTGLQLSRYQTSYSTIAQWPTNNLILNCTSKNNCDDATMENADGFAAKLTCGEGNVFDGCMSYNNSDDGWDLFAKTETGPIGVVTIQNSIAFRNGYTEFGEGYGDCDGNGFKLGGSGVGSAHIVKNCLAFENLNCGFTDNNNPELAKITDCTAVNNSIGGNSKPNFSVYRCTNCDFDNLMSFYNDSSIKIANDKYVGTYANGVYYNSGYYLVSSDTTVTNGDKIGTKISAPSNSDFISTSVGAMGTDFHSIWRNADGSINNGGFFETNSSSTYSSMGYKMYNGGIVPIVTTTTKDNGGTVQTTTTTVSSVTPVTGGYVHNFTLNDISSSFYTISGNLSTSKGTVNYGDLSLTQCLKMETATSIAFTSSGNGTLTLVFVEPTATIMVDNTKYTSDGTGIITVSLSAGSHTIAKADSANLFYMSYADEQASTTEPNTGLMGDANSSGKVDIADSIKILQYIANSTEYSMTEQEKDNADVYLRGDGINAQDALAIQKYLAKGLTSLPESFQN